LNKNRKKFFKITI